MNYEHEISLIANLSQSRYDDDEHGVVRQRSFVKKIQKICAQWTSSVLMQARRTARNLL